MVARGLDLVASGLVPVGGCCKHGAELFVFYEVGEILTGCLNIDFKRTALHRVIGYLIEYS